MAVSVVGLYFPRHVCNCHSQNALWFLLACRAALRYWLVVGNHSAHLLQTIESHVPEYTVCLLFLKAWNTSIFVLTWLRKHDTVMKVDIPFTNPCLNFIFFHQERDSAPVIGFVLNDVLSLLCQTAFAAICTTKKSPFLLINDIHCMHTVYHISWETLPQRWKRAFQIQMCSVGFCRYSLCTC